ncbi:MAG: hypothetical protein RIQ94_1842 [Pseudomonadota bacterium]|jgi:outer membrane protein OmpA-like peptidoglycan-associated protein
MKIRNIVAKINVIVFITGSLLGIYAVLGFYVVPVLIKSKLPAVMQNETGRKVAVKTVQFNPFSLQLNVQGVELQDPGGQIFVGFDAFFVDINALQSLRQQALVLNKVLLSKPVIRISKDQNGEFNFNDLLEEKSKGKQEDSKIFPLTITTLAITEGKLDWEDTQLKSPIKEMVYPFNFTIENVTTQLPKLAKFSLSLALSSGGKLDWQGTFGLKPVSSSGHIKLDNVQLSKIQALALQDFMQLDLQGYELFEADYQAGYSDNKFNVQVNQGKFSLHEVQILPAAQDKVLVKVPIFSVQGIDFNFEKHELAIESVVATDVDFKTGLNAEGRFNYPLPVEKTDESSQQQPWNISINTIELNNFGLSFEDLTLKKPVTLVAKPINFKLTHFSNKAGTNLPFQLSVGFNKIGLIKLSGNTVLEPLSAKIAVEANDIALENFQSYVDKFTRLDVIDGRLAVNGTVMIDQSRAIRFTGSTNIADFLTRDQLKNKDLVKWDNLAVNGIDVDVLANRYHADTLIMTKPYARVIIRKDKTVNFSDVLIAHDSPANQAQSNAPKPEFKLGKIEIIDGSSDFADLSLILPFSAQIKSLNGGASGISSEQKSTIKLDLKGNAYDLAPVDISGEISPYLADYQVTVNFTGMPMPLISSYMVQFAGYKVEKGKMSLGLNYKVANKQLTASNNILIDQFELGEKVENPNAVSLPLELAVALMKDADGKIKIDVPISGSLEDPQFSVSHIVVDALVNSISKVLGSPFRALAALIGSEADLSTIGFSPGEARLDKLQLGKLDDLAKALKARPDLKLDIKGASFQEQDWPAVSDDALYDQLKRIKAAEINKQGGRKVRPEYVVISDQDYRRLMEQLFIEKFPLMVEKSLLGITRLIGSSFDTNTDKFYAVAKEKLSAIIQPEPQRLKNLASQRAQAIANYLVQKSGIANDRIFILDTAIDPVREGNGIVSLLSLKASDF